MTDLVGNLCFIWHIIRASENLLETAISKSDGELREYFRKHLKEERGHALWLMEDLKTVGVNIEETSSPIEAIDLVGPIYYLIFHVDPCALLGYMKVLEGWPMDIEKLRILGGKYPAKMLRTLEYHAKHDPQHLQDIEEQINLLDLKQKVIVFQTEAITRLNLTYALQKFAKAA